MDMDSDSTQIDMDKGVLCTYNKGRNFCIKVQGHSQGSMSAIAPINPNFVVNFTKNQAII